MRDNQHKRGKAIHRRTGQTFYYATRLLPRRIREQTYVLYGFFRIADEIVDNGRGHSASAKRAELEKLREEALGQAEARDPVVAAFASVRETTEIPEKEVNRFIDAMLMDIDTDRYESHEELSTYMRGSAAAVGNMMTAIMSVDNPEKARPHAMALGEAFQLTNFIRDVREDSRELGRIYIPQETLREYDVSPGDIESETATSGFKQAIRSEIRLAENRYRKGVEGIKYLPSDCQFAVVLAAVLYAEHHTLVRDQEYDVLRSRPELSRRRKLWTVARTWWSWKRFRDPATVFRRVSAIPETDRTSGELDRPIPSPE